MCVQKGLLFFWKLIKNVKCARKQIYNPIETWNNEGL